MKKLILIIAILLSTSYAEAFHPGFFGSMRIVPAVTDACSATPSADADIVCEDFEGTGYLASWTEVVTGAGAAIDEDTAHSGTLSCADKGSHSVQLTYPATRGEVSTTFDAGAGKTSYYYQFYLNVVDAGLSSSGFMILFVADDSAQTTVNHYLRANYVSATTYNIQMRYYTTSYNFGGTATSVTLDEDTWHRIEVEGKPDLGTIKMWVDGTLVNSETNAEYSVDPRYFRIGEDLGISSNNTVSGVFQVDRFKIDDDTMPEVCP